MTMWSMELFSYTYALITLNIPSNQIAGGKFSQRVREKILTGKIVKNYSTGNSLFTWEL